MIAATKFLGCCNTPAAHLTCDNNEHHGSLRAVAQSTAAIMVEPGTLNIKCSDSRANENICDNSAGVPSGKDFEEAAGCRSQAVTIRPQEQQATTDNELLELHKLRICDEPLTSSSINSISIKSGDSRAAWAARNHHQSSSNDKCNTCNSNRHNRGKMLVAASMGDTHIAPNVVGAGESQQQQQQHSQSNNIQNGHFQQQHADNQLSHSHQSMEVGVSENMHYQQQQQQQQPQQQQQQQQHRSSNSDLLFTEQGALSVDYAYQHEIPFTNIYAGSTGATYSLVDPAAVDFEAQYFTEHQNQHQHQHQHGLHEREHQHHHQQVPSLSSSSLEFIELDACADPTVAIAALVGSSMIPETVATTTATAPPAPTLAVAPAAGGHNSNTNQQRQVHSFGSSSMHSEVSYTNLSAPIDGEDRVYNTSTAARGHESITSELALPESVIRVNQQQQQQNAGASCCCNAPINRSSPMGPNCAGACADSSPLTSNSDVSLIVDHHHHHHHHHNPHHHAHHHHQPLCSAGTHQLHQDRHHSHSNAQNNYHNNNQSFNGSHHHRSQSQQLQLQLQEPELKLCEWEGCENTFLDMEEFVKHLEDKHVNQVPEEKNRYFCLWSNCKRNEQEFNARYKLLIHMRVHSGEKPYPCNASDNCTKSFSRLENLKIHMRSHTGEKPYKCSYDGCPKSFTNSSDRIKHHKTHKDPKPYACSSVGCNKRYTDPSSLRKHLRAHRRGATSSQQPMGTCNNNGSSASSGHLVSSESMPNFTELVGAGLHQHQQQACPADFDPAGLLAFDSHCNDLMGFEQEGDGDKQLECQQLHQDYQQQQQQQQQCYDQHPDHDASRYLRPPPQHHYPAQHQHQQYQQHHQQQHQQYSRSWCAGATRAPMESCEHQYKQQPATNDHRFHSFDQTSQRQQQSSQQQRRVSFWQPPGGGQMLAGCSSREQQHGALMRSLPPQTASGFRLPHFQHQQQGGQLGADSNSLSCSLGNWQSAVPSSQLQPDWLAQARNSCGGQGSSSSNSNADGGISVSQMSDSC